MTLVLVDVDGTLLAGASSERAFIFHLAATSRLRPAQLGAALAFAPRYLGRFGWDVLRKNKAYLAGLPYAEVAAWAEAFVARRLVPDLRPSVVARIEAHRGHGDDLALLTGTPDFIAAPLAARLGIAHRRATRCASRDGLFTAAPPTVHPFGADKVEAAAGLCRELGTELGDAVALANSIHDAPLLRAVGVAVAVHPDVGLARLARHRGWEVLLDSPRRGAAAAGRAADPTGQP